MPDSRYAPFDAALWPPLLELCRRAGESICAHYNEPTLAGKLREKADDSPLTRADLASHELLEAGLRALTPEVQILSEESDAQAIAARHSWTTFWMVDPLDGTREFLERSGEFTINIALIHEERAIAGLIFEPLASRAYCGALEQGARCLEWRDGRWDERPLVTSALQPDRLVLLASRRHRNARLQRTLEFLEAGRSLERRDSGSALKFCDLAAGRGDCYPRFSLCSEWDVAAGDALVTAAGGAVLDLSGKPVRYNRRDTLLAEPFLAIGDPAQPLWGELLAELASFEAAT